jgi:hypothetical protein
MALREKQESQGKWKVNKRGYATTPRLRAHPPISDAECIDEYTITICFY